MTLTLNFKNDLSISLTELISSHVPSLPTSGVCVSMAKEEPSVFAEKDNRISATVRKKPVVTGKEEFYDVGANEEDAVEKIRDFKQMKHREMVANHFRALAIRKVKVHVGNGSGYKEFQLNKGARVRQQLGLTG